MDEASNKKAAPQPMESAMQAALVPVLQIVHVTDLHVKDTASNAIAVLSRKARAMARVAKHLQRHDWFGWEEGTQGHLARAPKAFERFLATWRSDHLEWRDVPAWLVDTGDRSAFGDPESIAAGGRMLDAWSQALGGCPVRSLYGNHDMWPQTLPLLNRADVKAQWQAVRSTPGWNPPDWLTSPLSAPIPGHHATIELYALDTIAWGSVLGVAKNTLAVGQVRGQDLLHLRMRLQGEADRGVRGLRILALHHPVAFPWLDKEVTTYGRLPTMKLLKAHNVASYLNNEGGIPAGIGPWAHLLLSGHTHMSHPAAGLAGDVASLAQRPLGPYQAQLVGSSMMLNSSSKATRADQVVAENRTVDGFAPSSIYAHPCLAQILQFYALPDPTEPWIQMIRTPVYSNDAGRHYVAGDPDDLLLHYRLPDL